MITSAGLVLAATFAALGVIPILFLAQISFIVAFGVLLDTFVVRSLLVPRARTGHRPGDLVAVETLPALTASRVLPMNSTISPAPPDVSPPETDEHTYVITFVCEDRPPGIVHAISGAIVEIDGNIGESRQFGSGATRRFYMRVEITTTASLDQVERALAPVVERYRMEHRVDVVGRPLRTLVLASKAKHCVNDILFQIEQGHLPIDVPLILANHDTMAPLAAYHGVPFEHRPIASAQDKAAFEDRVREAIAEHDIELVVLARYMQILSPELCEELAGGRCINIHHSFLPGFKGANPLPSGVRPRCEADRCDRPLRHRRPRRGTDHRAGRDPRGSQPLAPP